MKKFLILGIGFFVCYSSIVTALPYYYGPNGYYAPHTSTAPNPSTIPTPYPTYYQNKVYYQGGSPYYKDRARYYDSEGYYINQPQPGYYNTQSYYYQGQPYYQNPQYYKGQGPTFNYQPHYFGPSSYVEPTNDGTLLADAQYDQANMYPYGAPLNEAGFTHQDRIVSQRVKEILQDYASVSFTISNGDIVLRGVVPTQIDKNKIEQLIRGTQGVRSVSSQITVVSDINGPLPTLPM